jgi:hypothetical protein
MDWLAPPVTLDLSTLLKLESDNSCVRVFSASLSHSTGSPRMPLRVIAYCVWITFHAHGGGIANSMAMPLRTRVGVDQSTNEFLFKFKYAY